MGGLISADDCQGSGIDALSIVFPSFQIALIRGAIHIFPERRPEGCESAVYYLYNLKTLRFFLLIDSRLEFLDVYSDSADLSPPIVFGIC
ncbi:MAG: hypothetical protein M0Q22_08070 [Sulfuritalea sp.]|nr:hypothetical protein [Sulfuritalea sp.]